MLKKKSPSDEDDDLALITRKLNKYMRCERFRGRKSTFRRDPSKKESSSHAKRRMKKAMMATWSESEESSTEENEKEVANMCFMAIDDLDEKEESLLALPPPQQVQGESSQDLPKDWKFVINHPQDQIIGNPSSRFEMSMMGELNFFLGLQIKQLKEGTFINQAKYIRDPLKRFNMEEAKTMKTPMSSSIKLDMDEKGKPVNSTMYRGMIGSLLNLTASRPDIMYSVWLCARFQSCPKESHLSAGFPAWGASSLYTAYLRVVSASSPWHHGERRAPPRLRASAPTEPSQPEQAEARRKARYDTTLFSSNDDYQCYKQNFAQRKVVPGSDSLPNWCIS
ncbi:Retrovirus-related Pol polyprotein from transposon RE1 [Vitis vinifera]|uniref:Retrovirus-related Pol polyprotein from transposon RE1 n=1 Tax=Vitis vinifera TaxID=29760 RepID=A0A438D7S6_VITVI|nr:Retrovirus-related Pol polyprotein from transposon RE1 [Vitis vinifera]